MSGDWTVKRALEVQIGRDAVMVTIQGWVRTRRVSKNVGFLALNDGSCLDHLQVVCDKDNPSYNLLAEIHTGASVQVHGELQQSMGKGQAVEMLAHSIELVGASDAERYPLQKKGHTLEYLREIAHLRPRTNTFGAVFRLKNLISRAIHHYLQEQDFIWVHTPILTASDCEGAGEMFSVSTTSMKSLHKNPKKLEELAERPYFGSEAYLTVSGQLEAEAVALSHKKSYTFGPTFRAENSNTARHLSEFWMVEPELAFADYHDSMRCGDELFRAVVSHCLAFVRKDIAFLDKIYKNQTLEELEHFLATPTEKISYTEAIEILKQSGRSFEYSVDWGMDLQTEHERYLCETHVKGPVWVYDYPKDIKAFYMYLNEDQKTVRGTDLLVPRIGEICGGSQREDRLDVLEARMQECGVDKAHLDWYLDLRRYGTVPHAGFGVGLERLVMWITGMSNIRDAIFAPRAPRLLDF